jgi:hypothetical protein
MQQSIKDRINKLSDSLSITQFKNDLNKVVGDINKIRTSTELKTNRLILKKKLKKTAASLTKKQWYLEAKNASNLFKKISQNFERVFAKDRKTNPIKKTNVKKYSVRSNSIANGKSKVKKVKTRVS